MYFFNVNFGRKLNIFVVLVHWEEYMEKNSSFNNFTNVWVYSCEAIVWLSKTNACFAGYLKRSELHNWKLGSAVPISWIPPFSCSHLHVHVNSFGCVSYWKLHFIKYIWPCLPNHLLPRMDLQEIRQIFESHYHWFV